MYAYLLLIEAHDLRSFKTGEERSRVSLFSSLGRKKIKVPILKRVIGKKDHTTGTIEFSIDRLTVLGFDLCSFSYNKKLPILEPAVLLFVEFRSLGTLLHLKEEKGKESL
ncbi:hypothetical protein L2E82_51624 [Cichorium intybus]|nr:hypothetical protein L2E82_51624 [Cichorium intybus]